jgi:hypothetical protein
MDRAFAAADRASDYGLNPKTFSQNTFTLKAISGANYGRF